MKRIVVALALACLTAAPAAAMTRVRSLAAADHYRDGKARYAARDYKAALHAFQESYSLEPAPAMWINIGQCLRALGRNREAIGAFERFLDYSTGGTTLRAEVFQALDAMKSKLRPHPPAPVRDQLGAEHYYRGRLAYDAGDWQRALDEFQRAYERAPAPGMLVNLGHCLRRLDRSAEAIAAYRTFLDQSSGSSHLRLEVFEALETVRRELDHRMYKLAVNTVLFRRYLDSGAGSTEVRVMLHGTLRQVLDALVRLDDQASARYFSRGSSTAVAQR